ncbi:iron-sulfur cluster repair di-iron protein [Parapedobacter sp. 10938]|uniref:iron-sulfur cluster repair di-iron protein n=1 Tax=Parapedobacter flavus TaxID=3110225 RepID=UPI002DBAA0DA|nr:iron-sulfur cluster repair di-iron protein [Parapedobacter sp. 10938]MEC3879487.1 iron-sulfur cluster repair di-iron protein [Parapedobacter sp. 10938]
MIKTAVLDVTQLEPRLKHPTIFEHFDALEQGESFIIHNDHDPRPLYYQLLGERGNIFTWDYLESGPETWQVQLTKPAAEAAETVGEIAAKDMRKAEVFKKLGIDFCCGGKKTLKEAIAEVGLTEAQVKEELERSEAAGGGQATHDFDSWDLGFLADYIYNVHHKYVRESGPVIEQLAEKVASRHGAVHPELFELSKGLKELMADMYNHQQKEERVLFPAIKTLEANGEPGQMTIGIEGPVHMMEAEHDSAGDELKALRKLTKDYELPADACNSYTYLFEKIKEFENDLFQHIHLENNILFPKALKLEKERLSSAGAL